MRRLLYTIIVLCIAICACQRKSAVGDGLNRADSLINVSLADSALAVLDSLDLTDADDEMRAHHALLTSKATSMAFPRKKFDDSLLILAADYYAGRGDSLDLQAQFLLGMYLGWGMPAISKDYNHTLLALKRALDIAHRLNDTLSLAKIHYALAGSPVSDSKERGENYLTAGRYYQSIGRLKDAVSCISTASRNFNAVGNDSLATALLLEIREIADSVTDNIAITEYNMAITTLSHHYLTNGDIERSTNEAKNRRLTEMSKHPPRSKNDTSTIYIRGTGFMIGSSGQKPTHSEAINDSLLNLIVERQKWPSDSFKFRNTNEARANFLANPYTQLLDEHYRSIIDKQQLIEQQSQLKIKLFIALAALFAVVALAIYLIFSRRLRSRKLQLLSLVNDIDNMRLDLSQLQNRIAERSEETSHIHPYQLIDSLCELRQNAPSTSESERVLGRNVARFIDKLNSPAVIEEIESFVNAYRSDVMVKFREQFPKLTPRQYQCVLLIFAGFSASSIAALLNYPSDGAYRTERSRLKRMIEQSSAPDKTIFAGLF